MEHVVYTYAPLLTDYLPNEIKTKHNLLSLNEAFQKVHSPDNSANINELANFTSPCHRRIVFDEFFILQTVLALKKRSVSIQPGIPFTIPEDRLSNFLSSLPFSLTNAQNKSLHEILPAGGIIEFKKLIETPTASGRLWFENLPSAKICVICGQTELPYSASSVLSQISASVPL